MSIRAWQLGSPDTVIYKLYDSLRKGLNRKLAKYILSDGTAPGRSCIVLEAGSGPAFASSIMAVDPCVQLSVAVDIDRDALMEARRRAPCPALVVADVMNLPFRNDSLDITWSSSTVEHLESPGLALAEMVRVTCPGGRVFVGVPNLHGPLGFEPWIRNTAAGIWIGKTFSRRELQGMMKKAGLRPTDSLFYFFRFFVGITAHK